MIKQVIIGLATEGNTDTRFLESVVRRTFEDVAFECSEPIEIFDLVPLEKSSGSPHSIEEKALDPHFSHKVRSRTPEALQNLGFDGLLALEQKRQCVVRIQLKIIIN